MNVKLLVVVPLALVLAQCASQSGFVDTSELPDTYQCSYMKDVCKEAREFEAKFAKLTKEEQKEFRNLLTTYRSQCNDAMSACRQSESTTPKTTQDSLRQ